MKVTLAFLCLLGTLLSVDAACDPTACSLGTPLTGAGACATYDKYINCLNTQASGCTGSIADGIKQGLIKAAIVGAKVSRSALGNCPENGAGGITVSIFSLLLPVIIAFFKS